MNPDKTIRNLSKVWQILIFLAGIIMGFVIGVLI